MSVVKSKRGPSGMKFIDNARELEIFTIQRVAHFPKRYTFLISNKIADIAVSIYENVVEGNMLTNLDVGLGLGSQVSQIFALAAANKLDHMIKEELGIKFYERYMNDGCLIYESKSYLTKCLYRIQKMCDKLGIKLNKKKTTIIKLSRGFTWLKTKFYIIDNGRILRKMVRQSTTKMRQKLRSLRKMVDNDMLTVDDVYMSFQSWRSYAKVFDAHRLIMAITQYFLSLYPEF